MRRRTSGIQALIAVDKPRGMTSHDVVDRVRRALGESRVGHAGTLDPDATGVLVVGVGQATRLMGFLTADRKSYDARIRFGTETSTDDEEGEVVVEAPVPVELRDERQARAFLATLVGPHDQVPPRFSAISVDGRRAYDRARAQEDFELEARPVTIFSAELISIPSGEPICWECSFDVSKGCYIRSIARDVGRTLGTAAHLSQLRRTSSGPIGLDACLTLGQVSDLGAEHILDRALDPVSALGLPTCLLSDSQVIDVSCGRALRLSECRWDASTLPTTGVPTSDVCVVAGDRLMGIWSVSSDRLVCKVNFPGGISGVGARALR